MNGAESNPPISPVIHIVLKACTHDVIFQTLQIMYTIPTLGLKDIVLDVQRYRRKLYEASHVCYSLHYINSFASFLYLLEETQFHSLFYFFFLVEWLPTVSIASNLMFSWCEVFWLVNVYYPSNFTSFFAVLIAYKLWMLKTCRHHLRRRWWDC